MKKWDMLFTALFLLIASLLIIPATRSGFETLTEDYPYLMGFVKTSILATMGEMLASRIAKGRYLSRSGMVLRFFVWGFLGFGFVLMFKVYAEGVGVTLQSQLLPTASGNGFGSDLYTALMISLIMNLTFAPAFMLLHRVTDTYIDLGQGQLKKIFQVKGQDVINHINWHRFCGFVLLKTIPLFWIPAHTVTFLLPENYRVLMAGFLSIALGLILTLSSIKKEVKA